MDFDIDAVSLVTYDVDENGLILTWSPYSNLTSKELLEASMKLPVPTGQELEFREAENHKETVLFFLKYKDLFTCDELQSENFLNLEIDTVRKFELLKQLLEEKSIPKPIDNLRFIQGVEYFGLLKTQIKDIDESVENIYNGLKQFIDKHNLYFDQLNDYDLSRVVNNITTYSLYESIIDPIDLMQSMESVDGPTDPIKAKANTSASFFKSKVRNPGNWVNKIESILENQEGKDCIAISAVGIKGFFALTQYFNKVLNSGDLNKQKYLVGRKLLANIRAINPDTIVNLEIVNILIELGFQEDQAIVLSALLGLSADNAKELALAKLNAGSKTIGLYLYAITTGMDFNEISDLMMSRTGLILRSVLDDDIFLDITGYSKLVDAFDYFTNPFKFLLKYNKNIAPNGNMMTSPLEVFEKALREEFKDRELHPLLRLRKIKSLKKQFDFLDSIKGEYKGSKYGKDLYLQLIEFAKSYLIKLNDINWDTFYKIETLAKGADEMRLLGAICGLNQGIRTDLKGILLKCELIEDIFDNDDYSVDFKGKVVEELGSINIDLNKFAFNPSYRQKCIDLYDLVKHTFNILDCVSSLDHILGYIQTLATDKTMLTRSYKFRSIANNYKNIMKKFNFSYDDTVSGLERYTGDKLVNDYLKSQQIVFPAGTLVFDQENPLEQETSIRLGDDRSNATFRRWMENEVIPNLQKGDLKDNKFIKDLSGSSRNNTVSGNSSIVYTLPINMLPRTDNERSIFNQYLDSFNKLSDVLYKPDNLSNPVPVMDLFILYSMIAFDWRLSQNSLVPILENQKDRAILKNFYEYESNLDKGRDDISQEIDFKNNAIGYCAPKGGPYNAGRAKYTWGIDPVTEDNVLWRKLTNEEIESIFESNHDVDYLSQLGIINKYTKITTFLDVNYFTKAYIKHESELVDYTIRHDNKTYNVKINWTKGGRNDNIVLSRKDEDLDEVNKRLRELKDLPTINENGVYLLDKKLINNMIKQILTC